MSIKIKMCREHSWSCQYSWSSVSCKLRWCSFPAPLWVSARFLWVFSRLYLAPSDLPMLIFLKIYWSIDDLQFCVYLKKKIWPRLAACVTLVPQPGIEHSPLALETEVVITGPSGKFLTYPFLITSSFILFFIIFLWLESPLSPNLLSSLTFVVWRPFTLLILILFPPIS